MDTRKFKERGSIIVKVVPLDVPNPKFCLEVIHVLYPENGGGYCMLRNSLTKRWRKMVYRDIRGRVKGMSYAR